MTRYQVVKEECLSNLEQRVDLLLVQGWQLAGGVAVVVSAERGPKDTHYLQALVHPNPYP